MSQIQVTIERNDDQGLIIYIKSDIDFSSLYHEDKTFILGGVKCYYPKQENLHNISGYFIFNNDKTYQFDGPNLALLCASNLENGVTFKFGLVPFTENMINNWLAMFKNQIENIHATYFQVT